MWDVAIYTEYTAYAVQDRELSPADLAKVNTFEKKIWTNQSEYLKQN